MNSYLAFYKGRQIVVLAETSVKALVSAVKTFKARRQWDVTVMLAQRADGTTVVHTAVN